MPSFSFNEKWFKLSYRCLYSSVAVLSCLQESVTLTLIIQPIINNGINQVNKRFCLIGRNRSTIRRNNQVFHDTNVVHFWFRGRSLHARKSSGYNRCKVSDFNGGLGKACVHDMKMTRQTCRLFHDVFTLHCLTALMWLGVQGNGAVLTTNSSSFDGVNTTKAATTQSSEQSDLRPTKDSNNFTLGTKLIF